jgi:hypothetical protein
MVLKRATLCSSCLGFTTTRRTSLPPIGSKAVPHLLPWDVASWTVINCTTPARTRSRGVAIPTEASESQTKPSLKKGV